MFRKVKRITLNARLLIYTFLLLTMTALVIGFSSFQLSKNALDERGRDILENGVHSAIMLIEERQRAVEEGRRSLDGAQESIKEILLGPMNEDGTRPIDGPVDLGEHGYFIIYSPDGYEVMHPTLEGQNVLNATDMNGNEDDPYFFVQDKINGAMAGGSFVTYTWDLPHEDGTGEKIAYSEYNEEWEWIVSASTYMSDFNEEADSIMWVTFAMIALLVLLGVLLSVYFFSGFTKPLMALDQAMTKLKKGQYEKVTVVGRQDEVGQLTSSFNDMVEAMEEKDERIFRYAYYDDLTGLPNRNWLNDYVEKRLGDAGPDMYLILLDVRNFKVINSLYGHSYGDQMIRTLGKVLKEAEAGEVRPARIGGNEFGVWVEQTDGGALRTFIESGKAKLNDVHRKEEEWQPLRFHIGVAQVIGDLTGFEDLYQRASVAMQVAKNQDLDDSVMFTKEMLEAIEEDNRFKNGLEDAMIRGEFELYYQEKRYLSDASVMGLEALCRWESPTFGMVSPARFIPMLDQNGMMVPFTEYVTVKALTDYPELARLYGPDVEVSINIPPNVFLLDEYRSFLMQEVKRRGIRPERIILEITEDVFIADMSVVIAAVDSLRAFGFRISLDDFGTGYSSLSYISQLQTDEVKVDKSFIDQMEMNERSWNLLKSIIRIAKSMNYQVVAEGVETAEQVMKLKETGCDIVQGYVYSKPLPLKRIS
ncbi:EAL domain-containing protein [Salisediminibacterium selenitireducens]|uniref:Diguanylate cyclase/phosphodiesterase with extracellular sensor n=1 Tax=Bacillus selenitireducens (strain ATCC 700615 / DSM 15326 / MLS10) TaxID=439292 RepID=D6XYQ1_BACIE|nr:EAL domain-containing protein [Salisediminibacterium selenitireducens]ADH98209.1 diguanylate cyclase/phosphodiesterase with extracellular sensor [[Bacillus] selenitireducens MLS10]